MATDYKDYSDKEKLCPLCGLYLIPTIEEDGTTTFSCPISDDPNYCPIIGRNLNVINPEEDFLYHFLKKSK